MVVYTDNFDRANTSIGTGLGNIPGGPAWQQISGAWRIYNNRANTTTAHGNNPIVAAEFHVSDGDITVNVGRGGDAIYFRVQDANDWLRARTRYWVTSYTTQEPVYDTRQVAVYDTRQVSVTKTEYRYRERTSYRDDKYTCLYGESYNHHHNNHDHNYDQAWTSRVSGRDADARQSTQSAYSASYACWSGINHTHGSYPQHIHYFSGGSHIDRYDFFVYGDYYWAEQPRDSNDPGPFESREVHDYYETETYISHYETETYISHYETVTHYTDNYRVYLEQSAAGAVSTITSANTGAADTLRVVFTGSSIQVYVDGIQEINTTDATHQNNTKHGIGRGASDRNYHSLDNFSADIPNTAPSTPTGLSADVSGDQVNLSALSNDPEGQDVRVDFTVSSTTTAFTTTVESNFVASGATATAVVNNLDEGSYTVTAKAYDSMMFPSGTSGSITFTVNLPHDTPTIVSPAIDVLLRRDAVQRFEWIVNDPYDSPQTGFDIRFRKVGGSWTTYNRTSANSYFDLPIAQFTRGVFEWQVRTYDDTGLVSPWSNLSDGRFTYNTPPATPTSLSRPSTAPTRRPTFTANTFDYDVNDVLTPEFEIRDNSGTVVHTFTSSVVSGGSNSISHTLTFDLAEVYYDVRLRVVDESGSASPWTPWYSFYTNRPPNTPTLDSPTMFERASLGYEEFAWTFNSVDTNDYQNAWALRVENLSTETFSWWDDSTSSWVSTETWNTRTVEGASGIIITNEDFPIGTQWEWSVNTRDSLNDESGYASPSMFYAGMAQTDSDGGSTTYSTDIVVGVRSKDFIRVVEDAEPEPDLPDRVESIRLQDEATVEVLIESSDSTTQVQDNISGEGSYILGVLKKKPIGFWRLSDADATAQDFSGLGNHGEYIGTVTQQVDPIIYDEYDTAVYLDTDGYIDVPGSFDTPLDEFTFDAWVVGEGTVVSSDELEVSYIDNVLQINIGTSGQTFSYEIERALMHVAISFYSNALWVYANGEQVSLEQIADDSISFSNFMIGGSGAVAESTDVYRDVYSDIYEVVMATSFIGKMDEVSLFDYRLTSEEVANQYRSGVRSERDEDNIVVDDVAMVGALVESHGDISMLDNVQLLHDARSEEVFSVAERAISYMEELTAFEQAQMDDIAMITGIVPSSEFFNVSEEQVVGVEFFSNDVLSISNEEQVLDADIYVSDGGVAVDTESYQQFKFVADSFSVEEDEEYSEYDLLTVGMGYTTSIRREPFLVSLWRMNSVFNMRDESGYGNDLDEVNLSLEPPIIAGDYASVEFDGVSSYLSTPETESHQFGRSSFTVEFWSDVSVGTIIERDSGWSIWVENGDLYASLTDRNGTIASGIIHEGFVVNQPSHVAVVFDRGINTLYGYINGEETNGSVYIGDMKSLSHGVNTITIGNGSHGYLAGVLGEVALIASSVTQASVRNRYFDRIEVTGLDRYMESTLPYAYYRLEEGEFLDAEISDYTLDSFVYEEVENIAWNKQRGSMSIVSGGVDVTPFNVKSIEFTASPSGITDELVYHHEDTAGGYLDIYIRDGMVRIEESDGVNGTAEEIAFINGYAHVAINLDDNMSSYFVDGIRHATFSVDSRADISRIRLFSLDATAGFTGIIDYVALYDEMLQNYNVLENYSMMNSGRYHYRVYDLDGAGVTEGSYKPYSHDWVTVTA